MANRIAVDPLYMFRMGESCYAASRQLLYQHSEDRLKVAAAAVLCNSFACEAYMKAILMLQGAADVPQTHDLETIFSELNEPTRQLVERWWDEQCQPEIESLRSRVEESGYSPPRTLAHALRQAANAFVEWRYGAGDDELYSIAWLPGPLRAIALQERPDLEAGR